MSWFNNLVETYDRISHIAGVPDEKGNILWPLNHMAAKTDVSITINGNGGFRRAEKSDLRIIIPYTEDSSSRAGAVLCPHPLHDQLGYLTLNRDKRVAYLAQLEAWHDWHPKVSAVYKYVVGGTLLDDLHDSGIKVEDKLFVRFRVETPGDLNASLWEDISVIKAWQNYCLSTQSNNNTLCYVKGESFTPVHKHLKGINLSTNSAKIISCNDESNYTYKGRFTKSEQANSIGAITSHKAHAILSYLIATQGHKCDTQAVVAWQISNGEALPDPFASSFGLSRATTAQEKLTEAQAELHYAKVLREALQGRGTADNLKNWEERVAVISVDAATTGRMGITFYQELSKDEYLDCIVKWHETCCWRFSNSDNEFISAPSVNRIIAAVYGEPKGEGYTKIQKQARERLLHSILCATSIDKAWVTAAIARVSNPFSYSKQDGGLDIWKWMDALSVTCAIVRKYHIQKEEELSLELETTRTDRDYLFGRLLAIADRLETHARYLQTGKNDTDKRPTNAVRYMTAFAAKPLRTWKLIFDQLNPYIQRLDGAEWYQRQIDDVMSLFNLDEFNDKPLGGKYLIGYSLQRRELQPQSKNQQEEVKNDPN